MIISNNSDLEYLVHITKPFQRTLFLKPHERFTFSQADLQKSLFSPGRYLKAYILYKDAVVYSGDLEINSYVGLLGPKPHISIHFDEDSSPEAKVPTQEMLNIVKIYMQEFFMQPRTDLLKNEDHGFGLFCCRFGEAINKQIPMRPEQLWSCYQSILKLHPSVSTDEKAIAAARSFR